MPPEGTSEKNISRSVFSNFQDVLPGEDNAAQRLRLLVQKIDQLAQPLPMPELIL